MLRNNFLKISSLRVLIFFLTIPLSVLGQTKITKAENIDLLTKNIHHIRHACIKINGEKTIYIDPFKLYKSDVADLILITHDHYDHCDINAIDMIIGKETIIVAPEIAKPKLAKYKNVKYVKPDDQFQLIGVDIKTVPMYSIKNDMHPRENNYVGYVFNYEGITYYHAGDCGNIPEMKNINTDVAFIPVDNDICMTPEEAVSAVESINPKVVVPIHLCSRNYGTNLHGKFKDICKYEVRILSNEH